MLRKYARFLDLKSDIDDYDAIHRTIKNGIIFKGTNLWILVFAIIIASIGLNINSTAVIIGAMLISPLMGPINGMGYSIATYDLQLFQRALKNFGFAVSASLVASTLYFSLSPLSTADTELLARTSPTIYDVLIALFGGLAGIVGITSKHKGNIIPGVAIATALMPPLCTAGFGLATGQMEYFFGALYLFTINTVFIGISSVLFSQLLAFPIRKPIDPGRKQTINRSITFVIMITIIPSIYFGYIMIQKERFTEKANAFVNEVGVMDGSYLLKHEIVAAKRTIRLVYGGDSLTQRKKDIVLAYASGRSLEPSSIVFEQGFSFNSVSDDITKIDNTFRAELNRLSAALNKQNTQEDSVKNYYQLGKQLLREVKAIYPEIRTLTIGNAVQFSELQDSTSIRIDSVNFPLVMIGIGRKNFKKNDRDRLELWVKTRLERFPVKVHVTEIP